MTEEQWLKFASQNIPMDGDAYLYSTVLEEGEVLRKVAANDFCGFINIINRNDDEINEVCVFSTIQPTENADRWTLRKSWTGVTSTEDQAEVIVEEYVEPEVVEEEVVDENTTTE